jgi:hypothetical protein
MGETDEMEGTNEDVSAGTRIMANIVLKMARSR